MKVVVRKRMVGNIPLLEVVAEDKIYEPLPLIIYYHGWQTAKELVLTQGRKLAAKNFRVLLPDAANHGERKTKTSEIPSLTFWDSIQTNLYEFGFLVDYFESLGLTVGKIGVGGLSMGGITTCMLLTQHPEIDVAACVMGSPAPIKYRERIRLHASDLGFYLPKDYRQLTAWLEGYDLSLSPEKVADRPLFFWHGTMDEKIPYQHTADFVEANPQKKLTFVSAEERHFVQIATMDQIAEFFDAELNLTAS
ncbi:alpha/beta fold hydrolase [Enterococcus xiangfangensis]|uniref:Alpha/beta fold hydrolase n=1 Tax=Enterococcus xiangfangensis TaxID=1296537 RepID=A0ABU3F826_9ENTE|nr:alpha/beta fold hydrolase [Enterococcus xiangfangensis]MDT2758821.1 alpha/beta fold hydrolase [Enterococcus xiangfangensis]